jgi:peptide/nickel transport system substrate-binding protein
VERLNPQIYAQAQNTQGVSTETTSSFQNLLALYNTASGPMADVRVRKAVRDAIDFNGLISALKGADVQANGVVPKGLLGFNQNIVQQQNLDEAKSLLAQAGYGPGGNKLSLTMTYAEGDSDQQLFATLLTSALQQLGVELKATPLQWNAQWDRAKSADKAKRQDIFVMYWYPDYADAYSWFINVFHSAEPPFFNLSYWNNPVADKLIDSLPALTAVTPPLAQAAYTTLQKMIIDQDAVASVLYVQNYQRAYSATVKNYVDNPAYPNVPFVYNMAPGA